MYQEFTLKLPRQMVGQMLDGLRKIADLEIYRTIHGSRIHR